MITKELLNNEIGSIKKEDVVALTIAEPGAMGEPGEVEVFCKHEEGMQVLIGNYVYDNFDLYALLKQIKLSRLRLGVGDAHFPKGWKGLYMGMGNHLIVREDLQKEILVKHPTGNKQDIYVNRCKDIEDYIMG